MMKKYKKYKIYNIYYLIFKIYNRFIKNNLFKRNSFLIFL